MNTSWFVVIHGVSEVLHHKQAPVTTVLEYKSGVA